MKADTIPQKFQDVNRRFEELAAKGDLSDLSGIYTRGARLLPPGAETVEGVDSIQQFWASAASVMGVKSLRLETLELEILGDSAVEVGAADLVAEHVVSQSRIKYVVIWKKQDGDWRWDVDIWNTSAG